MTHEQAFLLFKEMRWGKDHPICPQCAMQDNHYFIRGRKQWRCKCCVHTFSVTSGTIFAFHKLPLKIYLAAIAIYANAVKGLSALQLGQMHKFGVMYLANYANEAAYREDTCRWSNGEIFTDILTKCVQTRTHKDWCGYWQGNKRKAERLMC
ncbi:transposase [Acinetobacter wuhouensis]|uniref:transposase n=1 Tax=Acinetobacter wuhouensis TaxID=1879050 RepID=UPI002576AB34|nr:transposase [Acinetobacter wuhouensis]